MSSAFTPPDTLTKDDRRTVADVRRTIWKNGFLGLGTGTVTGMVGHMVLQWLQKRYVTADGMPVVGRVNDASWVYKCLRVLPPLGRNTFMLSFLSGGALGSMVLSTTAGKNAVHLLHPIFGLGKDENAGKSPYQIATSRATQQQQEESIATSDDVDGGSAMDRRTRSLRRKDSVRRRLESGGSLTNSHSNTWPHDERTDEERAMHRAEAWEKRQTTRREALQDRIEHGRALSDSTGGHWSDKE